MASLVYSGSALSNGQQDAKTNQPSVHESSCGRALPIPRASLSNFPVAAHSSLSAEINRPVPKPQAIPAGVQDSARDHLCPSLSVNEVEGPPEKPIGEHGRRPPIPSVWRGQGLERCPRDCFISGIEILIRSKTSVGVIHQGWRHFCRERRVGRNSRLS